MRYGVEHGLACALSLSKVMEVNLPAIQEAKELLAALGVRNAGEVQEWLDKITDGIVRLRLSSFGVQEKDIPKLVGMCFTLGRMDNNPVALTPGEVEQILRAIL
jgi:alcohol dehydrogenase class IV